ncbi:TPA: PGF-pre-PGF domain-containing protein [Candidatus Woesearchaeota archaeon]|nr:PGF-pre-PGF domain-containing protein [Candidatus Woesearchaeota archaeon]HIH41329.1 PGF-pre-PGF domain-containing protein [Candidatus Woesearchaeota archaeon]
MGGRYMKKFRFTTLFLILITILLAFLVNAVISSIVLVSPANDTWTTDTTPDFSYNATSTSNATVLCELIVSNVGYGVNDTAANNTVITRTANDTIAEGSHLWYVNCTDTDVAVEVQSEIWTLNIDATAPTTTITSPANNSWVSDSSPELLVNMTDAVDTTLNYTAFVDGGANATGTATSGAITSINLTTLSAGTHTVFVEALDENGNNGTSSVWTLNIDTTNPTSQITSPTNNAWTTDTSPEFLINLTDTQDSVLNYTVFVDGGSNVTGTADNNTITSVNLTVLANGAHTVVVEARDEASNRVNSSAWTINIDTANPTAVITNPPNNSWLSDETPELLINLTDALDTALNYTVFVDGSSNTVGSVLNNTITSVNLTTSISNGTHTIEVQATDEANNSANSTAWTLNIDTVLPTVSQLNAPANNTNVSDGDTVTFNFTSYDNLDTNLSYILFLNKVANETGYTAGNNTSTQFTVLHLQNSTLYNWTVQVTDDASNIANYSGLYYFRVADTTPLTTFPTLVSAGVNDSDSDGNIEIGWTADSNAFSYRLYRSATNITNATSLTEIANLTATSFEDNTTINGTTYWYAVTSLDDTDNENKSQVSASFSATANDTIKPKLPTNVNATTLLNGSVNVSWTAPVQDVNGGAETNVSYRVFRTTNVSLLNTSLSTENIRNTTELNYIDTTLTTGTNYTYVVTSLDDMSNYNGSIASGNQKNIVPSGCTAEYNYSAWAACTDGAQTRTGSRICSGGDTTLVTEQRSCGSGGSSGGSSGGTASTNPTSTYTKLWASTAAGEKLTLDSTVVDVDITEVSLVVGKQLYGIKIIIEKYSEKPTGVSEGPAGEVYSYLSIDKVNFDNADITGKVTISFKVSKAWLEENGVAEGGITLLRYVDGEWQELSTSVSDSDEEYVYYEARAEGFSFFAIAGERTEAPVEQPQEEETPETEKQPAEPEAPAEGWKWNKFLALAIILVLAIGLFYYLFAHKGHSRKHPKH